MTKIITSVGKGSAVSGAEDDANQSSLAGINTTETGTTHTVDVDDQNDTVEYSNASAIAVTLPAISTLTGSNIDTDDFKVTFKNIGAGKVTITADGAETFDDGDASKSLLQYEFITIQTDSTLGLWNIINERYGEVTGTFTTSSLSTSGTDTTDITHNLGTDDVEYGFVAFGNAAIYVQARDINVLGRDANGGEIERGVAAAGIVPALPSSGDIRFDTTNGTSATQTVTVNWYVRLRR